MDKSSRKSRSRAIAAGAAAVLAGAAVAACGSSPSGSSSSAGGTASPAKTLTIICGFGTTLQADFNPFQMATDSSTGGTNLLYLPLAVFNPLNGKYSDYLATSVDVVSPTVVDFTLRSRLHQNCSCPVAKNHACGAVGVINDG